MKKYLHLFAKVIFLFCNGIIACTSSSQTEIQYSTIMYTPDKHSFAKPEEAVVKHLDLELLVNFEDKTLCGTATWTIENHQSEYIWFDTKDLFIQEVKVDDKIVNFQLHEPLPFLGSALQIPIQPYSKTVQISYCTSPQAEALQWLTPAQTYGKRYPFLFTQSQAILARSWIPCQDSPGIRVTYEAVVRVPCGLLALMSAENPQTVSDDGVYHFRMMQPIPSYLFALAVGNITFKPISSRCGVYAEPEMIEKCFEEFSETEKMIKIAETLYGTYRWGRYDILLMPPSFPFGGMENPRLTFATPTILTGDRSLVALIAHELAHSWSGNLVTNATWNDFWINEGFTVYFEMRIMEKVAGKDYADMLALIGYYTLLQELEELNYNEDTKLKLNLEGRNPDDAVNAIAYDKGYFFLRTIEEAIGREAWDNFMQDYFNHYAFQAVDTETFLSYLEKKIWSRFPEAKKRVQPEKWVYEIGLPENCPKIYSQYYREAEEAARAFAEGEIPIHQLQIGKWYYQQWVHFLNQLPSDISLERFAELDAHFRLSESPNTEILFCWFLKSIQAGYKNVYARLQNFLTTVGRRKFVLPLYAEMLKKKELQNLASEIYHKARPYYHYVTMYSVDKLFEQYHIKVASKY